MKNIWHDIADMLTGHSLRLAPEEKVYVQVTGEIGALLDMLLENILRGGGVPVLRQRSVEQVKAIVNYSSEEQLKRLAELDAQEITASGAFIGIQAEENRFEMSSCDQSLYGNYVKHYLQPVQQAMAGLRKWVLFKYPTYGMAQTAGMSLGELAELYRKSCCIDYSSWSRKAALLGGRLDAAKQVRIVSPGTDLRFSIEGIPHYICDGKHNLPDGEVFTAPVAGTVSGRIAFNIPVRYLGMSLGEVTCRFEDGNLVEVEGTGAQQLQQILGVDEGASRIGEFGIGLNPYIRKSTGSLNMDEKMAGSIHLAFGQSFPMAYNGNESAIHLDMVLSQCPEDGGGELYLDGELVRKDGRFVARDLRVLDDA
ncbi:aminopeptidase [Paenibacillus tarimensis]|uniref:aminopeptidase n=1 Tax=Paenibacillus tarimensis TaxID=416012 RepID=UPI001F172F4E|nr:aminopeptidase [Paenibacillus tarimensis]MCF2945189.1 aminopeptidase [Paenibacillus tarimensis]